MIDRLVGLMLGILAIVAIAIPLLAVAEPFSTIIGMIFAAILGWYCPSYGEGK